MTDPDGLLPGRVAELEADVAGLFAELTAVQDRLAALAARTEPGASTGGGSAAPPGPPAGWRDRADAAAWSELAGWVDWLAAAYDLTSSRAVLPCWPAHPGVVEELAALRDAWQAAAVTACDKPPNDALAHWHDRYLHPTLARLRTAFQQNACADRHGRLRPGAATDPQLLEAASGVTDEVALSG